MADLNDRGQLILVTGLAIAVAIIVLVVLLNSVIYSQNLATRSVDAGDQRAVEFRNTMTEGVSELLAAQNGETTDRAELGHAVHAGVVRMAGVITDRHLPGGTVAELTSHAVHNGTLLVQDNRSRDLTSAGGSANWTLATNADGVRSFDLHVDDSGLFGTSDASSNATRVVVEGAGGNEWHLYVYETLLGDDRLAVKNGTESSTTEICPGGFSDGPVVDVTGGTVEGTDCPRLAFAEGVSPPYDVRVGFGNHSQASYNLTVNATVGSPAFNGPGSTSSPYEEPVVYSTAMTLVYRSPDLLYETRVVVAPEGADE